VGVKVSNLNQEGAYAGKYFLKAGEKASDKGLLNYNSCFL
jgi:hypothetical protein